ncbi:TolC family protein [Fibrella arboris]|uniref:TolC family protein n=1 Tax=Fibrella arboris TaxID=3242486 RepID=UPI0035207282
MFRLPVTRMGLSGGLVACLLSVGLSTTGWAQTTVGGPPAATTPAPTQPTAAPGTGQAVPQRLGLQQCIDIALANNLTIRQSQLQLQNSEAQLRQARLNRLPNVGAFLSQGYNSGRNINPATNAFVDQGVLSNNFQATAQVTVYNGGLLQNTIRQNDLLRQSNEASVKATENNVTLTVVQNYLNVLTGQEQLVVAQRQIEVSQAQLDRTQRLVNAGSLPEANLFDIRAQIANDELAIVNAQNNIDLAKLALLQAMNVPAGGPTTNGFDVQPIAVPDPTLDPYNATTQQVYDIAQEFVPDIKAADLRVRSDAVGVQVARANLLPSLTLNGNVNTLYSNVGRQKLFADGTTQVDQTVLFNGIPQTVTFVQTNYRGENYTFGEQLGNNLNRSVNLQLQIPIFNRSQARTRILSASLQQQNSEIAAANTRLQLRQTIETAYTNLKASSNRYRATAAQVAQLARAFQASESRFNAGALNSTDYNVAKGNLDRARASLVQAKYDYVFRTKILDFYQNKPLTFD